MSQEIREKALHAAISAVGGGPIDAVVAAAQKFEAYIAGDANAAVVQALALTPVASKAAPATKAAPKAPKPAPAAPAPKAPAPKAAPAVDPDAKKLVGDKVNELLKANLREQAVALLASFNGATSATGIVQQGDIAVESFLAQADELLSAEAGGLAD